MNNFIYENKTKVYFGKGSVKEHLGALLKNYGETVMLAYGGGSIKQNGVYDEVVSILNAAGKRIVEFPGIMPNPTYAKVQEGAKLAREKHVDLILAVGGGSVSDCCKIVSAQAMAEEDIWTMVMERHAAPSRFIPLGTIVIPGSKDPAHIQANFELFDFELTAEELSAIAALNKNIRYYTSTPAMQPQKPMTEKINAILLSTFPILESF